MDDTIIIGAGSASSLPARDPEAMKVHGLEGLRITDACAIPIMVAERACQKILAS